MEEEGLGGPRDPRDPGGQEEENKETDKAKCINQLFGQRDCRGEKTTLNVNNQEFTLNIWSLYLVYYVTY